FAVVSALRRFIGARGVDLAGVVAATLFRVRQQVVGGRYLLEPLLGALVARIEVGMQLFRKLPVGLADLLGRRGLGDAEDFIGVLQMRLRTAGRECLSDLRSLSPEFAQSGPKQEPADRRGGL